MKYHFGALVGNAGTTFRVWAPAQRRLSLRLDDGSELPMRKDAEGFFTIEVPDARPGRRYWYQTEQALRADPASRFQPEGPLGPSEIVDLHQFPWSDNRWRGVDPSHRQVFYEMHIGTFTQEGTWAAAIERLPQLADLGVTTLEVMPIASFPGRFGWGYDGVHLFAPTQQYGAPHDVQRFVDQAHALGLAVILDVVYNHFGPVGNFFAEFAPSINGEPGEWGDSINYDGDCSRWVRDFMKENAAYWIREFHFDGLRIDAVHAIRDTSDEHVIAEICRSARDAAPRRNVFIVGECETQDTRLLRHTGKYSDGLDAIWNEDWHHAAFVRLTGRRQAYFTDYRGTAQEFASMARHGFLYQGQWYSWQKHGRGGYALGLPGSRFVSFLENHDQVANTGVGVRLHRLADQSLWRAMTAMLLLGPALPLILQGQEFGSSRPFVYFADHEPELAEAVERGRLEFLAQFPSLATSDMQAAIPQPAAAHSFERCKLLDDERGADNPSVRLYRDLLRLRTTDSVLSQLGADDVAIESSAPCDGLVLLRYLGPQEHRLLVVNLADERVFAMNDPLLAPLPQTTWRHLWSSDQLQYGGNGVIRFADAASWTIPARSATLLGASLQ